MTKDWVRGVGQSPVCQILLQIVVRSVITSSPPALTSSARMLSTPPDFPFFNFCTAASTSLRRMGWSSSVSGDSWVHWSCSCTAQSSILSICRSSVRHFPERSWTVVAFPCFTVVKSFTSWYTLLLLFFLRFSSIWLHCSPIQFSLAFSCTSWCCCSLSCIFQILQAQIFSFSVLSFRRTDQEFVQWSRFFFFFWRCLQRISLAVSVTAVLKMVIIESMSVSSLLMMVRGANLLPIIAWKVSNTLGSFSFSMSNLSTLYTVLYFSLEIVSDLPYIENGLELWKSFSFLPLSQSPLPKSYAIHTVLMCKSENQGLNCTVQFKTALTRLNPDLVA